MLLPLFFPICADTQADIGIHHAHREAAILLLLARTATRKVREHEDAHPSPPPTWWKKGEREREGERESARDLQNTHKKHTCMSWTTTKCVPLVSPKRILMSTTTRLCPLPRSSQRKERRIEKHKKERKRPLPLQELPQGLLSLLRGCG